VNADEMAEQVRMCAACPKMCRHICPTFFAWRSDSPTPHGRALLIHYDNLGVRPLDERAVEVLYQCLECSHCLTWCVPGIDIASIVEAVRERIVAEERAPPAIIKMAETIESCHNPYGEDHTHRNDWVTIEETDGQGIVYFTGCTAAYRETSILTSTTETLTGLGYNVIVTPDEWCCGSPLFRTGFKELALSQARHNVNVLNSIEAEAIVVTCPGCYRVLTQDYPENGLQLNKPVLHLSQLLADRLDDLPKGVLHARFTYHDPCHLGRHSGVYEPPRQVITRLSADGLVEMQRNRDNAMCCGNGAGLRTLFPEKSREIGAERVRQAVETGADYLVTACPFCKNMLASQSDNSLNVIDLPELVQMATSGKSPNGSTD